MSHNNLYRSVALAGVLLYSYTMIAADSKLRVKVEPPQAYIFVDGLPVGDGTRTVKVPSGTHSVGVYNYGFTSQVKEVNVESGTITAVEFKLDPVTGDVKGPWGRIQVESASRAAVLLNGKTPDYFVGHGDEFNHGRQFLPCCVQQLIVPPGSYPVTLMLKDKVLWSGTVKVNANERVIINAANGSQRVKPWVQGSEIGSSPRFKAGTASATVAVAPVSASLAATPGQINCGDTAHLNYTTAETVERSITSGTEAAKQSAPSGEVAYQPTQTTTYTLQASGPGGTVASDATVNVNTAVQSSLQASPAEIRYRRIGDKVIEQGTSNVAWTVSNASTVSIDPLGSVGTSDTRSVKAEPKQQTEGSVNEVQTYTLTAKNICGGSDTQTASLRIVGSIEPIPAVPLASVFFPTGYPDKRHPDQGLLESQQQVLAQTAAGFKAYLEYDPDARLSVLGNTDERDSSARNNPLSERRAERVKKYLVSQGVPEGKIETVAQGKDHLLDAATVKTLHEQNPNKPPKSLGTFQDLIWAYNRRADLVLLPKGAQSTQYFPGTVAESKLLFNSEWPGGKDIVTLAAEKEALPVNSSPPDNK
ncbi:MAG TPA: OmpA family protein [Candidatus Sulfotelmatobacter sp.]|nr:OmpA family protein [Candidatus Sulfotelmatobacter sp.]